MSAKNWSEDQFKRQIGLQMVIDNFNFVKADGNTETMYEHEFKI